MLSMHIRIFRNCQFSFKKKVRFTTILYANEHFNIYALLKLIGRKFYEKENSKFTKSIPLGKIPL